jgi:hypothetical protein
MMTTNTFDRFHYNFDSNKFGDAINLSDQSVNVLNQITTSNPISEWQKIALANGPLNRHDYFKNPVANVTSDLITTLNSLANTSNGAVFTNDTGNLQYNLTGPGAQTRIKLLQAFWSHTNNVSGYSANVGSQLVPVYDTIKGLGTQTTMILNSTDGVSNAIGMLGCMTSLFIGDELTANVVQFQQANTDIANGLTRTFMPAGVSCNISADMCNTINVALNGLSTIVYDRINGDWYFYQSSGSVGRDSSFLNQFSQLSTNQAYLINNLIGTDKLKANLALHTA